MATRKNNRWIRGAQWALPYVWHCTRATCVSGCSGGVAFFPTISSPSFPPVQWSIFLFFTCTAAAIKSDTIMARSVWRRQQKKPEKENYKTSGAIWVLNFSFTVICCSFCSCFRSTSVARSVQFAHVSCHRINECFECATFNWIES